ncbi:MAG: hypothetical protein EA383_05515 [Spirochaetaceae bacterium]|nr:MAG: hypothetical protein EA383_05515 [Spirochaetaceae bacterium]
MKTKNQHTNVRTGLGAIAVLVFLSACGNIYRADIQGRVEDADNETGVNRATVRVYEEKPDEADSPGFLVRTETATSGGTTGVFQTTVVWRSLFGSFGDQADTTSLWLGITAEDYGPLVVEVPGILSDASNTVGTFRLLDTTRDEDARSALIQGRVFRTVGADEEVPVAGYLVAVGVENPAVADDWLSPDDAPEGFDFPRTVTTGATGAFAFVVEWPGEEDEPDLEEIRVGLFYWDDDPGAGDRLVEPPQPPNPPTTAAALRTITVEDGDNEFVRDVVRDNLD